MTRHVAPHRWADALAGRLGERDVARMEMHAEVCDRCAHARARVQGASHSFPAIRAQPAPELPWDEVRARVHWSVSSARRSDPRPSARRAPLRAMAAVGALAAGAVALGVVVTSRTGSTPGAAPRARAVAGSPERAAPAAPGASTPVGAALERQPVTPFVAIAVREQGDQALVDGVSESPFSRLIGAGVALATGAGRLDLQFDDQSAFSLGPATTVKLARLDSEQIELALVEGTLDVTVSRRGPGQRFLVTFGERTVEVRGTQFRVQASGDASRVTCAHGKVAVRDRAGEIEVGAARRVELAATTQVTSARAVELSGDELKAMVDEAPMTLPVWTSPPQLVSTSSPLAIATTDSRDIRVDGVEVGKGPLLRVRVMPGRHTIETADAQGRFRRAGWVDVAAGAAARLDVHADATSSTGSAAARRRQLHAGIDHARLARCTRSIAKVGVSNTFVKIEIAVDRTGAVEFLNVIDTDLPSETAGCVREVLAGVRFHAGPAARFRDRLDL